MDFLFRIVGKFSLKLCVRKLMGFSLLSLFSMNEKIISHVIVVHSMR
jgi:hypothetical protein